MLPSRKLTRREFIVNFPLAIAAAKNNIPCPSKTPKFGLGDRVMTSRICDDSKSLNYGDVDWEKGYIVGYCWEYDEWRADEFIQGWTYFIKFYETNNPICFPESYLDFEHESRLKKF